MRYLQKCRVLSGCFGVSPVTRRKYLCIMPDAGLALCSRCAMTRANISDNSWELRRVIIYKWHLLLLDLYSMSRGCFMSKKESFLGSVLVFFLDTYIARCFKFFEHQLQSHPCLKQLLKFLVSLQRLLSSLSFCLLKFLKVRV